MQSLISHNNLETVADEMIFELSCSAQSNTYTETEYRTCLYVPEFYAAVTTTDANTSTKC